MPADLAFAVRGDENESVGSKSRPPLVSSVPLYWTPTRIDMGRVVHPVGELRSQTAGNPMEGASASY
jgi:hypothetical protein